MKFLGKISFAIGVVGVLFWMGLGSKTLATGTFQGPVIEDSQENQMEMVIDKQGKYEASDLTKDDFMFFKIKDKGYILQPTTSIEQIEMWYQGEHEVVTDSLCGGKAYSFWVGNKYENYLYVETLEDGKIFSYGSVDPSYKTNADSYGDAYPYYETKNLQGYFLSNSGKIMAGVYYNKASYFNGNMAQIRQAYEQAFLADQLQAMYNLHKHAIPMSNAILHQLGKDTFFEFNETHFYVNQQLKEFGTSLAQHMSDMENLGRTFHAIGGVQFDMAKSSYYCMNPLLLASMAKSAKSVDFEDNDSFIWEYKYETKGLIGDIFSKNCLDRPDVIELTQEEKIKLANGRQEYELAMETFNQSDSAYKITPVCDSLANMKAGELQQDKKEGITHYYNAIRAAAGLPKVTLDEDGFNVGQHLSTLLSYRWSYLKRDIAHALTQTELEELQEKGLTTEYYHTAIGWGKSWGSDISRINGSIASPQTMISHINNLLEDSDGKSIEFGHRNDLLKPSYSKFGMGCSPHIGVVELSGTQSSNGGCTIAWPPANGVAFIETVKQGLKNTFWWTARFISNYKVLDTTTTKIKCLNTGEEWEYTKEEKTTNRTYQNETESEGMNSKNNKIVVYDSNLAPKAGYVYEVTISGLKNTVTGATDSYKYRTVFEKADTSEPASGITSIKIDVPETLKQVATKKYEGEVGETFKLTANIGDTSVTDKKITWVSSNPEAVSVTQNGIITIQKAVNEDVIICVSFDGDNSVMDQITIKATETTHNLLKGDVNKDGTVTLYDALQILRQAILGGSLTEEKKFIMDYNEDGKVTLYDALKVLQKSILG